MTVWRHLIVLILRHPFSSLVRNCLFVYFSGSCANTYCKCQKSEYLSCIQKTVPEYMLAEMPEFMTCDASLFIASLFIVVVLLVLSM